jgi:hypothetical protein
MSIMVVTSWSHHDDIKVWEDLFLDFKYNGAVENSKFRKSETRKPL